MVLEILHAERHSEHNVGISTMHQKEYCTRSQLYYLHISLTEFQFLKITGIYKIS
jgi:hypothetical protein